MIVTAAPLRSWRDATTKWDWNMSEVFETLRPCCKDLADASERGWRPSVTSFPLSQALHDEWPCERQLLHRFGIASLRVFVSWFLQKKVTRASFFLLSHVISEVKVIYGCQEVPRGALMPEKTLTCISCVKRPWGGPILDPVAWEMKAFQRLPGPLSSRPDPRTNLFHLLFLLAGGGGGGSHRPLPPPPHPLRSLLLSSKSPQGNVAVPSFFITLLSLLCNYTDPYILAPSTKPFPLLPPSFPSLPLPSSLPPWASELDFHPFGFLLFLPSSVPPLIAPLFLTSQGCQLSGHSWKIHSQHGNCKQTERGDVWALNLLVTQRQKTGWRNSLLCFFFFSYHCLPPPFHLSSISPSSLLLFRLIIFPPSPPPLFYAPHKSSTSYILGRPVSYFTAKCCMELRYALKCLIEPNYTLAMLFCFAEIESHVCCVLHLV